MYHNYLYHAHPINVFLIQLSNTLRRRTLRPIFLCSHVLQPYMHQPATHTSTTYILHPKKKPSQNSPTNKKKQQHPKQTAAILSKPCKHRLHNITADLYSSLPPVCNLPTSNFYRFYMDFHTFSMFFGCTLLQILSKNI